MTRKIWVGDVDVGGGAPVRVQSMIKRRTSDVPGILEDMERLKKMGCEIVRVAVPREKDLEHLKEICLKAPMPVVADVHFNYRIALKALEYAHCVRINPGNIGGKDKVKEVVKKAKETGKALRIGVNAGSLEKDLEGMELPRAMFESAKRYVELLEDMGFFNFKVSLKASNPLDTVKANELFAEHFPYPLHIGVTEAGPPIRSAVKSAIALSELLKKGIGDTIRVSITGPPFPEVTIAYEILRNLGIRNRGVEIVSCPTCGRCQIDIEGMVKEVEEALSYVEKPIKVAVMGCVVNGPGEARDADVGLAGGKGVAVVFSKGKIVRKVKEEDAVPALLEEVEKLLNSL